MKSNKLSLLMLVCMMIGAAHKMHAEITELPKEDPQKIVLLSIPKSGTHLLAKALELITGKKVEWIAPAAKANPHVNPDKRLNPNDPTISIHHLFPSFDFIRDDHTGRYIKIIQLRDPRDALISQINWMNNCNWCWYAPASYISEFNQLPFIDRLTKAILFPDEYYSIPFFIRKAQEWMQNPDVLVCRFEDLVGPFGGGDKERQEAAVRAIAAHVGYSIDEEDVERIAGSLFGKTLTFKKGQIGSWQDYFTEEHKNILKNNWGELLIELGYEYDNNW